MKIWYGYGSEHSMNLVMIGQFKDARDADEAKHMIERLTEEVSAEVEAGHMEIGKPTGRYPDALLNVLMNLNIAIIGPSELEQFAYDFDIEVDDGRVILTTEESEFSALLKVLIENGARVEVYSAHDYPGIGYGRGG
jgi:hypothetical protein